MGNYGFSGFGWIDSNNPSNKNWSYDPIGDYWDIAQLFTGSPRFAATIGFTGEFIYYGLGYHGNSEFSDLWFYLPEKSLP
jgi:hypothetical protein